MLQKAGSKLEEQELTRFKDSSTQRILWEVLKKKKKKKSIFSGNTAFHRNPRADSWYHLFDVPEWPIYSLTLETKRKGLTRWKQRGAHELCKPIIWMNSHILGRSWCLREVQGGAFPRRKAWGGVTPKPYHGDLAILLLINWNTFTLELLQNFLQRFNLQHTAPRIPKLPPWLCAQPRCSLPALVIRNRGTTHSSPGLRKEGRSRGGNLASAVPCTDRRARSRGDSCCSEEPGSGICSTDYLEPMGSRRSSGDSGSRGFVPTSLDPESKNRGGEAGRERDAYKARNIAAARGVRGEGGTDQLLLMGGILHGGVDVQGSRMELGVLLG